MITRVDDFGGWWAKRDDLACAGGADAPAGSKVRQYAAMAADNPGAPMIVGCSPHSAMQIYVAAAARTAGVLGIVYTAKRQKRTSATEYALRMGAEVNEVTPGYPSVYRARARERAKALGRCVRWDVAGAVADAAVQVRNLPAGMRRVVVPTGSGLTVAGVLVGLAARGRHGVAVLAVAVSPLATAEKIVEQAAKYTSDSFPPFQLCRTPGKYENSVAGELPDGTALDPYYAAKVLPFIRPGDCLWIPGVRPLSAFPADCLTAEVA